MSKLDQIRALREAQYRERVNLVEQQAFPAPILRDRECNAPVPAGQSDLSSPQRLRAIKHSNRGRPRKTSDGFDKAAYQREYMRKRRAEAKE